MSGLDAPTTSEAKGNPVPVLLRVKTPAVLPNSVKANLKGCFVIADGKGNLATERAELLLGFLQPARLVLEAVDPLRRFDFHAYALVNRMPYRLRKRVTSSARPFVARDRSLAATSNHATPLFSSFARPSAESGPKRR